MPDHACMTISRCCRCPFPYPESLMKIADNGERSGLAVLELYPCIGLWRRRWGGLAVIGLVEPSMPVQAVL